MAKLEFHPIANIMPLMEGEAFDAFVGDIETNGLINPIIITNDGLILDGRNRYRACAKLGIEPKVEEYSGDNPLVYVLSANVHRRHLTAGQRVSLFIDVGLLSLEKGAGRKPKNPEQVQNSLTHAQVAERAGVSERSVTATKRVAEESPGLYKKVRSGEIGVNTAYKEVLDNEFKTKTKKNKTKKRKKDAAEKPRVVADFLDMVKEAIKVTKFSIEAAEVGRFAVDNPGLIVRRINSLVEQLSALAALLEQ